MKILCITDQQEYSAHSAIEGIFGNVLPLDHDVTLVYFSRTTSQTILAPGQRFIVPHRLKHGGLCRELYRLMDIDSVNIILVRNYFPVLRDVINHRAGHAFLTGFWHSFPHSFRRVFAAREEGKAVFRKTIEYAVNRFIEQRLIRRCDFLVAMTPEFRSSFYPDLKIPFLPLPMGVSCDHLPEHRPNPSGLVSFAYTGAVDPLRRINLILDAFHSVAEPFILDFYTPNNNESSLAVQQINDHRIRLHAAIPRDNLFDRLAAYDVGIGFVPDNELYHVSSPSKTVEYAAVGMAPLINDLPDYRSLFDHESAFFCPFKQDAIRDKVRELTTCDRDHLAAVGARAREVVQRHRDYRVLARQLASFLESVQSARGPK